MREIEMVERKKRRGRAGLWMLLYHSRNVAVEIEFRPSNPSGLKKKSVWTKRAIRVDGK